MARTVKDARIDSRAARERLATREEPYWRFVTEGAHLGYHKGKRGGRWVARFRPAGHVTKGYFKTALGEADDVADADGESILNYRQALDAVRIWFDQALRDGRPERESSKPYFVGDALDDYMAQFTGKSVVATRSRIEAIIRPALGGLDIAKLKPAQLQAWLRARAASPAKLRTGKFATVTNERAVVGDEALRRRRSTANRDFTVLKAALNLAFRDGRVRNDEAWRKVRPFKNVDGVRLRFLTDADCQRLVNAADADFRPLVQAALLTGARYGNLTGAKVQDFDPAAATLRFTDTKGGAAHTVYLEGEGVMLLSRAAAGKSATDLLFPRPGGGRWGPSEQGRRLNEASDRAKIERATFHDLRRTYGARLARQGVPMAVIASALGHADLRITTRHYAHLAPSYLSDTIRNYAGGLGIVHRDNVEALDVLRA